MEKNEWILKVYLQFYLENFPISKVSPYNLQRQVSTLFAFYECSKLLLAPYRKKFGTFGYVCSCILYFCYWSQGGDLLKCLNIRRI